MEIKIDDLKVLFSEEQLQTRIEKLDKEIFVKWTNLKNCKPVTNEYGEYI